MTWLLLFLFQDAEVSLTGRVDSAFLYRATEIEAMRSSINGGTPGLRHGLLLGSGSITLKAAVGAHLAASFSLANREYDDGDVLPLTSFPLSQGALFEEVYLEIRRAIFPDLTIRAGLQEYHYRLRPHGESFFLDTAASESFYAGTTTFVRNTADRDRVNPAGLTLRYEMADFMAVEAFAAQVGEEEDLYGLYLNGLLSERTSWFLGLFYVTGPEARQRVLTVGLGVDLYLLENRALELFAEAYGQFGTLAPGVDKEAWALQVGGRWYGERVWAELAFHWRSGDDDPGDGTDRGFQSYENVRQFALLEDPVLGLDFDTNLLSIRLAVGLRMGGDWSLRLDLGRFWFDERTRTSTGAVLSEERDLGYELDATLAYAPSPQIRFGLRAAFLYSDFMDALTGESFTWVASPGLEVRF